MRTVTIKLPDGLATRLDGLVRRRSATRSAVVREALESLLSEEAGAIPAGSCLDLARDLAGSLSGGPADLSSNKKHLRGFGR